jgi:hypothetical protein
MACSLSATIGCGKDEGAATPDGEPGSGGAEAGTGGAPVGGTGGTAGDAAAGAEGGGAAGETSIDFSRHRLYQHLDEHFMTLEACLAAQDPDFFINCYQEVDFCPDGSAVLILTDIVWSGTYAVGDGYIDTSWPDTSEGPDALRFDIVSPRHLTDEVVQWDWLLAEDASVSYCSEP